MSRSENWRELYRGALIELRPQELRERIGVAEKAIQERMIELRRNDSDRTNERIDLNDALRALRFLAATECKSAPVAGWTADAEEASSCYQ